MPLKEYDWKNPVYLDLLWRYLTKLDEYLQVDYSQYLPNYPKFSRKEALERCDSDDVKYFVTRCYNHVSVLSLFRNPYNASRILWAPFTTHLHKCIESGAFPPCFTWFVFTLLGVYGTEVAYSAIYGHPPESYDHQLCERLRVLLISILVEICNEFLEFEEPEEQFVVELLKLPQSALPQARLHVEGEYLRHIYALRYMPRTPNNNWCIWQKRVGIYRLEEFQ